jgi:hypothetical protein
MISLLESGLPAITTQKLFDHANICLGGQDIVFKEEGKCTVSGKLFSYKKEDRIFKSPPALYFNIETRNSINYQIVYEPSNGEENDSDKNNFIVWLF